MSITTLPPSPSRANPSTFSALADTFLGALPLFVTEANALEANVNAKEFSADAAADSAAISQANANFVGLWSDQSGAATVPYSVSHINRYWMLLSDLADVTSNEPGVSAEWQEIGTVFTQDIINLAAKGPGYWFNGVDGVITVPDSPNFVLGDRDFSIGFRVNVETLTSGQTYTFWNQREDGTNWIRFTREGDDKLTFTVFATSTIVQYKTSSVFELSEKTWADIWFTRNGTMAALYLNGASIPLTEDVAFTTIPNFASALFIGRGLTTAWIHGTYSYFYWINTGLSEFEVKALSSGAPVKFEHLGASQTEKVANGTDFTGGPPPTDWASNGTTLATVGGGVSGDCLEVTYVDNFFAYYVGIPTIIGKRYRFGAWAKKGSSSGGSIYVSSGDYFDFDYYNSGIIAPADWTEYVVEFTATSTELKFSVLVSDAGTALYDNVSLVQIGAVIQLEQPGIGHGQWIDISGNEGHGTNSGALPINLAPNHKEKFINLTVTGDTSFTLPKGYQLTAMTFVSDGSIGGGIDVGTSDGGGEVVNAMAVGGAGTFIATIVLATSIGGTHTTADDTLYITDADGSGWDGRTVEIRAEMKRLTVN